MRSTKAGLGAGHTFSEDQAGIVRRLDHRTPEQIGNPIRLLSAANIVALPEGAPPRRQASSDTVIFRTRESISPEPIASATTATVAILTMAAGSIGRSAPLSRSTMPELTSISSATGAAVSNGSARTPPTVAQSVSATTKCRSIEGNEAVMVRPTTGAIHRACQSWIHVIPLRRNAPLALDATVGSHCPWINRAKVATPPKSSSSVPASPAMPPRSLLPRAGSRRD